MSDNIRIFNVKLIKSEEYRGYIASKKRYFYGVRVQLLTTKSGIPVEFVFMPGSASDVRALNALPLNLPPGSSFVMTLHTTHCPLKIWAALLQRVRVLPHRSTDKGCPNFLRVRPPY